MEQYFSENPSTDHDYREVKYQLKEKNFVFLTDSGVFSKGEIDKGSDILLKNLPALEGKVLDMGCGYGLVGIVVKKLYPATEVLLVDINNRAVELSKNNAVKNQVDIQVLQADGLDEINNIFDVAIINPPIRAGKEVVYRLFLEIQQKLKKNGRLYIVIRTKQGAKSAVEYLKTLFENVNTIEIKAGYRVLECEG